MDRPYKKYKTVGVVLAYNCAKELPGIYRRLPKELLDDIILVDDASKDNTVDVAGELGIKTFPHEHLGYGGNIKFGLQKALEMGADYMVEIHGDGQYDPSSIAPALQKMEQGCDFVLGSRFTERGRALRDKMSRARYYANIGLSFFDRLVLQLPLTEFHTGFRVYSRKLLTTIPFPAGSDDYLYSFEIIVQARYCNLRVEEVPVRCDYSGTHTSVSIWKSTVYSFQMFYVLFLYALARIGIKTKLFRCVSR